MPPPNTPSDPVDAAARTAFRNYCFRLGGRYDEIATLHSLSKQTAKRLFQRQRPVPPGLAREVAGKLDQGDDRAALNAWADHCDTRQQGDQP